MIDFAKLPAKPVPEHYRRVLLVFPVKFLGNLLIAGNLIQRYLLFCKQHNIDCRLVLDQSFQGLLADTLDSNQIIWYPRRLISTGAAMQKLQAYWRCVRAIRAYKPDIAVALDEDALCDRLTQLSGATFKLGCNPLRNKLFYKNVLPIDYHNQPAGKEHRWYAYQSVFSALGLAESVTPAYLRWQPGDQIEALRNRLPALGVDPGKRLVTIHAGATKDYKKWPFSSYARLCALLIREHYHPVIIGAGQADAEAASVIMDDLQSNGLAAAATNLCGRLNLSELAALFTLSTAAVGNDSGPFHLAASLDLPGIVIFGPTLAPLWRPLGETSLLLQSRESCAPNCQRRHCLRDYACLKAISPEMVMEKLSILLSR